MRLFFVRHGQSGANTLNVISDQVLDSPITDLGWQQEVALAKSLSQPYFSEMFYFYYLFPVDR